MTVHPYLISMLFADLLSQEPITREWAPGYPYMLLHFEFFYSCRNTQPCNHLLTNLFIASSALYWPAFHAASLKL